MKLDPGMHIGLHLVFFRKSGVTAVTPFRVLASSIPLYMARGAQPQQPWGVAGRPPPPPWRWDWEVGMHRCHGAQLGDGHVPPTWSAVWRRANTTVMGAGTRTASTIAAGRSHEATSLGFCFYFCDLCVCDLILCDEFLDLCTHSICFSSYLASRC
jgi:hypothetical protein